MAAPIARDPPQPLPPQTAQNTVFTIANIFEAKVPISSGNERDDFQSSSSSPVRQHRRYDGVRGLPRHHGPPVQLFPDWSDKAAIELYYQGKVIQEGLGDYIIKPGDPDYEDPDSPFKNAAELRFIADNFTSNDDEQIDNLLAYYRSGTKVQ